jgi:hypothetical protein
MTDTANLRPSPMPERPSAIERAYQLAREGKTLSQIRGALAAEHYGDARAQLWGPVLLADLRRLAMKSVK